MTQGPAPATDATAVQAADSATLAAVTGAVHDAGARLLELYSAEARPSGRGDMFAALRRNEDASLAVLRPALARACPQAGWVDDGHETAPLSPGEWWAVDAVEGNVNHVHGLPEWCVTATLLRDSEPVLTAVYQPVGHLTYTAVRGGGAHLNGQPLHASAKSDLAAAIVTTGQAEAGQEDAYRRIGDSVTAMLYRALLVRATVPATFPLLVVAAGHYDAFWQYEPILSGIAAGVLLAAEAGCIVSDTRGEPWRPGGTDILVTAPGLHAAVIQALSAVA